MAQIEKITGKLAENRRKKLEEMLQTAKQNSKPASAPVQAAAPSVVASSSIKAPKKAPAKPLTAKKDEDSEVPFLKSILCHAVVIPVSCFCGCKLKCFLFFKGHAG